MRRREQVHMRMLEGFQPLDSYWTQNSLTHSQSFFINISVLLLQVVKWLSWPIRKLLGNEPVANRFMDTATGFGLKPLGTKRKEQDGGHYLSQSEVDHFEQSGLHGPFKLLESYEAKELLDYSLALYEKRFDNNPILGDKIIDAIDSAGNLTINYLGLWQAMNYPKLWDTLCKPELTHKLSSLLGDDLICWRSQYFELKPKSGGTFWHQTGTFRETADRPKLEANIPTDEGMKQLSVWIALKDVNIKNGCLRILEGSYEDGRLERLAYNLMENKISFMLDLDASDMKKVLKTMKYTSGYFMKSQLIFEFAMKYFPDLYEKFEVTDLEMKAGEAVIFTSLNTHASYPNETDDTRLAFAGRFTRSDVSVYKDFEKDSFPTPLGNMDWDVSKVKCIPVLGNHDNSPNKIATRPEDHNASSLAS